MKQLSGLDAAFLYAETPNQHLHIGGLGIYDQSALPGGALRFKDVLGHVRSRLHLSAGFRSKLARAPLDLATPYWVDDPDFDLEFHVRHIALTQPRDWRQLMIDTSRLHSRPIDLTRPPWELWVIEGIDNVEGIPPGSFGVLFKLHHSAVDGISAWEMVDALHDRDPSTVIAAPDQPAAALTAPNTVEMLARAAVSGVTVPFRLARTVYDSLPIVRETLYRGLREMPLFTGDVPGTRLNRAVGPHRVHDSRTFPLAELRRIKALVEGATINDVVITIVGGALREYLQKYDELPEKSLVAGCPISIRSDNAKGTGGNKALFAMIDVGSQIADPVERLRSVHRIASAKKEFTHAVPAGVLIEYAGYIPGTLAGLATTTYSRVGLANRHRPLFNTIVTNVPGSPEPLHFAGAPMRHYDAWGPVWDGLGIIHPVTSYCSQVTVSFDADRDQLPDPALYTECLQRSFEELRAAAD
jgi:diacylglycerol O-acyltransferase / wax synthase